MRLGAFNCSDLEFNLSKRIYRNHRTSVGPDTRITEQCSQKKKHRTSRRNHRDYLSLRHPDGPLSCHYPTAKALHQDGSSPVWQLASQLKSALLSLIVLHRRNFDGPEFSRNQESPKPEGSVCR